MLLPNQKEQEQYPVCWYTITNDIVPSIAPYYAISNYGIVYNNSTGNYLPQNINYNKDKYITISLSLLGGGHICVQPHRILMMILNHFDGCDFYDVNHKDGIKYHNWSWNLEWCTKKENIQHALNTGLFNLGETRDNSSLSNEQVHEICRLISEGYSNTQINNIMNIDHCNITKIVTNIKLGLSWKHISCNYDFSKSFTVKNVFSDEQIHIICNSFQSSGRNIKYKDILNILNIDINTLSDKELKRFNYTISCIRNRNYRLDICSQYYY